MKRHIILLAIAVFIIVINPGHAAAKASGRTGPLTQVSWNHHIIHDNTHGTASIYACDVDNDNDIDVLGAVLEDNQIVWWRNDGGYPIAWTKFVIAYNFFQPYSVYAADFDDDGDQDVVGAAGTGDQIAWWRNDGGDTIQWTKYTIRNGYDFAHEVYAHDLDEDGDMDVLAASTDLNLISWWRNDGGNPVQWTEQTIGANFQGAKSVRVGDLDDDGDNDVAGACLYGDDIAWWRNDGGDPIQWTQFIIHGFFDGAHRVQVVDIDEDQDLDILAVAYLGNEIDWFRNNGGNPLTWTRLTIGTGFAGACIAQAADIDGDGDLDVAGTAQLSHEVAWWRNDGGSPIVWTKFYIDDYFYRAWPLYVCDLDEDGDQDAIVASSWQGTNEVQWCENVGTAIAENCDQTVSRFLMPTVTKGPFLVPVDHHVEIYDITGREINTLNPTPGIYFLQIDGRMVQKIIKVK
jgi:hypothetical protein